MKKLDRMKNIYKKFWEKGALTKNDIADETGLSLTAVSLYINELVDSGWIIPREKADSKGGRRAVIYQINSEHKYIIGFDLKDTHFYIFLADIKGNIKENKIIYLDTFKYDNYINKIIEAVETFLDEKSPMTFCKCVFSALNSV